MNKTDGLKSKVMLIVEQLKWRLRAKDLRVHVGNDLGLTEKRIREQPRWYREEEPEESFRRLVETSDEYWSNPSLEEMKTFAVYDFKGRLLVDLEALSELSKEYQSISAFNSMLWYRFSSLVYLHYLNHKSDFDLGRYVEKTPWIKTASEIVSAMHTLRWFMKAYEISDKLGDDIIFRTSIRGLAKREELPLDKVTKLIRVILESSPRPVICLSSKICIEVDMERAVLSNQYNLKYFVTALMAEAPSVELVYKIPELI